MNKPKSFSTLLRILKFIGTTVVILLVLFGVATWIVFEKKNDWIIDQIQSTVNESQSGQLEITSIELKLFKSFPNITIELDGINYYEHQDSLRTPEEKPILHAEKLFVAFELLPLIREELKITEISLSNAQLQITENKNGVLNIQQALAKPAKAKVVKKVVTTPAPKSTPKKKQTKPDSSGKKKLQPKAAIQVDLQFIQLSNILLTWSPYGVKNPSVILIKDWRTDLTKEGELLTAQLNSTYQVQSLSIKNTKIPPGDLTFNADLRYERQTQQLTILRSEIDYDVFSLSLQGTYQHLKNRMLDIQIDASSNDLKLLSKIIKQEVLKQNPNLLKRGDIYVKGRIFGELKSQPPQFDISFGVKDLSLHLPKKLGNFQNVGFEGKFVSGSASDYSKAMLEINHLRGQLPGGFIKGRFKVNNFTEPYVAYKLDAQLKLDGYDQIFKINFLKQLSGSVSAQAHFDGPLKLFAKHQMDSSRSSTLTLSDLSFIVTKTNQRVAALSGKIENKYNQATLQQLSFRYGKNDVAIDATIDNLVYFLLKRESDIVATGTVQSNELFTKDFILDTLLTARVQDRISNLSFDFQIKTLENEAKGKSGMPNITFDINNLVAKLDKLPDLKKINAKGQLAQTINGLKLELHEFHAIMPQGNLDVTGDLLIPKKMWWEFNAKVKANKFPWTYVKELIAEIKEGPGAHLKNLPVKEMEMVTAELDLSAAIITYPFDIRKLDIRNSRVNFSLPGAKTFSAENLNLNAEHLYFKHPKNSGILTGVESTRGTIELSKLKVPGLNTIDINMNITGENDQLDIDFSRLAKMGKSEKGRLSLDISKRELDYHLLYSVQDANLETFIKRYYKRKLVKGNIDYTLDLRTTGSDWTAIKQNLSGTIEITGDSLRLYGVDIDDVLKKYKKSQNFNLADLGAVLIAGPVGLAVTKGSDFVSLATINLDSTHQTGIQTLLTKWKLEHQQLITEDVALATPLNRIAFNGVIDFAKDSIPGLTIAVVDKNGCSLMDQKLYGKMGKLKTGKLNITKTLMGSVTNFVNAVVGKDCKPIYKGRIKDPLTK